MDIQYRFNIVLNHLGIMLKSYSVSIAAVITTVIVFSALFIPLSAGAVSPTTTPTAPNNNSSNDFNTPTPLWKYPTNSRVGTYIISRGVVYTSPVIAKGVLYFASDDYTTYAVNATNGEKIWQISNIFASKFPMVDNDILYSGGYQEIYAIDAKSGIKIWESRVVHGYSATMGAPPVIANGILYVGTADYGLCALNVKTGNVVWPLYESKLTHVSSSPLVIGKVIYVGSENVVFALNTRNGRENWNHSVDYIVDGIGPSLSSFVFDKGVLYFCAGDGNAYALDASSGKKVWNCTYTIPNVGSYVPSSPVFKDGLIYVGSDTGSVYALNATDGTKLWNSTIGQGELSAPALYGDVIYFGSSDGNLYALNATNCLELWTYRISSPISWAYGGGGVGSPIVYEGVLYVGGGDGVYALKVSPSLEESPLKPVLSIFHILIIVGVIVVVAVCCVGIYLIKKQNRRKQNTE